MSKTIDQRVVEMRFDNKQFQEATAQSMSTLEKLKKALHLDGAAKGLDNISKTAKKIDLTPLANSLETVRVKFSSLEVIGVTALANLTNTAVNAGKRIASSLTSSIRTGLTEYETQINAIQTILANTQSKGSTLEDVNSALDELNKYADQTIYNFTEMTRNIGTFTAAGVDLEKSVTSIKGIANLAAVSGSNAQQASTAMYQLSQALAAGRVSLMDWNSVVNAGMGGEVFQTALKRTAKQMGYNVDELIKKYGSFRESLTEGQWLTAEVLTETLTQLSGAYSEADLIAQGYSKDQAKAIVDLANTAVSAATDVKTFTQLVDTLAEAAQSGWTQTWEILIGDFEEAKTLMSGLYDFFSKFIESSSNARNEFLTAALAPKASWEELTKKINDAGVSTETFEAKIKEVGKTHGVEIDKIIEQEGSLSAAFRSGALSSDFVIEALEKMSGSSKTAVASTEDLTAKLKKFQQIVDDTWRGDYGNGVDRMNAYAKAGYNYAEVQGLVNKSVDGYRLKLEDLSDEQLKSIGYTDEQIAAINQLATDAKTSGTAVSELIEELSQPSGRELIIETVFNILEGIADVLGAIGTAWRETFSPVKADSVYDSVKAVHDLVEELRPTEEELKAITKAFKGFFSVIDLVKSIVLGGLKTGFVILNKVLGLANTNVLDLTATIGGFFTGVHDFILENELINSVFEGISNAIVGAAKALKTWSDAFLNIPQVQAAITSFHKAITAFTNDAKNFAKNFVKNVTDGLKSIPDLFDQIGKDTIQGFINGLKDKTASIPDILINLGNSLLEAIKGVLGIHSPSTAMYDVGTNVVQGLINGIKSGIDMIVDIMQTIGTKMKEVMEKIPWGSIAAVAISGSFLYMFKKLSDVASAVTAPLEGLGEVLSGVGQVLKDSSKAISKAITSVSKVMNAFAFSMKAKAIQSIAISLAILAGSVFLLAQLPAAKLWSAVGAMAALAVVIGALSAAIRKFGPDKALSFNGFALAMVGVSSSILILAVALKKIQSLDPSKAISTVTGFSLVVGALVGILAAYGKLVTPEASANINKVGAMMLKISVSLLLMVAVIKLMSGLEAGEVAKGSIAIGAMVGVVYLLSQIANSGTKDAEKLGSLMLKLSASLLIMTACIKILGGMSVGDIVKGEAAILGFVGIIALLSTITKSYGEKQAIKLGATIAALSAAMLLMSGSIAILALISAGDIAKGEIAILGFAGIIAILANSIKSAGKNAPKIAATILAMSAAIAAMAVVSILLSMIDIPGLVKGITAVGLMAVMLKLMIEATRGVRDIKGNLIVMTVAIGVMATAIAALSLIDPVGLAGATIALSALMGMFALIIKSSANITKSLGPLIVMTTAIGLLGGIIVMLAQAPLESALGASAALSMVLFSISASMKIISGVGKISLSALAAMASITAILGILAYILKMVTEMSLGNALKSVLSLTTLLTSLTAATAILAIVGKIGGASGALQGVLALSGVILVLGGLMAAIGALVTYFPGLKEFVNTGLDLLGDIAYGIGSFIGNIVGGFMAGATSGLSDIAKNLSDFIDELQPFLNGVQSIDGNIIDSARNLAEMMLIFTASDILNAFASIFVGGSSMADFARELVPLGEAMVEFSNAVAGKIDAASVEAAANSGLMLAKLAATIPKEGGLLQGIFGTANLAAFGEQLKVFGEAIATFSGTVAGKIDAASVEAAANAGMAMANLANNIPKQEGFFQNLFGKQDLGLFGEQLKTFGEAIVSFSNTVAGNIDISAVESASNAGMILSELANNIPKQDGFFQSLFGTQDLSQFGIQLEAFGKSISKFARSLGNGIRENVVESAANAAMTMAKLGNILPKQNGLFQNFFGEQDMGVFGEQLAVFGEKFSEYSNNMANVNPDIVTSTANAAESIVELANSLPENKLFKNETTLDEFGKQIAKFGSYFSDYYSYVSTINSQHLASTSKEIRNVISLVKDMQGIDATAVSNFSKSLKKISQSGVDDFINTFSNAGSKVQSAVGTIFTSFVSAINTNKTSVSTAFSNLSKDVIKAFETDYSGFKTCGVKFVENIGTGIESQKPQLNNKLTAMVASMTSTIRSEYGKFREAGSYLVAGFAEGISSNTSAKRAARVLARDTIIAMERELDINSPSDVARDEVGQYVTEGVAEGITENTSAEEAAKEKAQAITDSFQDELDLLDVADETSQLESSLYSRSEDYMSKHARQVKRLDLAYQEYEANIKAFGKTSIEAQQAYNKYLQEEIDLRDLIESKKQEDYEKSIEMIEERKEASNLSLIEELAAYKRLQSTYLRGTEQRVEIDQKVLELQEDLKDATADYYDELKSIQDSANEERLQIDQDYEDERESILEEANEKKLQLEQEYADKSKEINDQLIADIEEVEKAYQDAVDSRSETLYNSYGLFDSVEKDDAVSGETLMQNLKDQLTAFEEWTNNINSLSDRGIDTELLEELREMGVSSASEIAALNAMSDEELNQYVELWRSKHQLAKDQAIFELQSMREESNATIEQLKEDAAIELEEYRNTWQDEMDQLNADTDEKLEELKDNWRERIDELDEETNKQLDELKNEWLETVVGLRTETENEFAVMTNNVVNALGDNTKWTETGANIIEGVIKGVADHTPELVSGVEAAMAEALVAANNKLGINSPSKEFEKVGRYSDLGFVNGLQKYASLITDSAGDIGTRAIDSLRNTISKISEMVDENMDAQPTIRPVLDLSDIEAGTSRLDTLFNRNQALSISSEMNRNASEGLQNGADTRQTGNVFSFTQNNYSPKSLSRVDIYRQTKNQFSAMERMVQT